MQNRRFCAKSATFESQILQILQNRNFANLQNLICKLHLQFAQHLRCEQLGSSCEPANARLHRALQCLCKRVTLRTLGAQSAAVLTCSVATLHVKHMPTELVSVGAGLSTLVLKRRCLGICTRQMLKIALAMLEQFACANARFAL